jgi:CrcB protein
MQKTIFIAVAGLVGTLLRYWLSGFVARQYGETFPGNDGGQPDRLFVTGAVFFLTEERFLVSPTVRTVIPLIGLLGGFTTFSSYGLQTFTLLRMANLGWRF